MNDLTTHAHSDALVIAADAEADRLAVFHADGREAFNLDMAEMHGDQLANDPPEPEEFGQGEFVEDADDFEDAEVDDFEDDGQPDEYMEWQDLNGGDDWDQGQFDY